MNCFLSYKSNEYIIYRKEKNKVNFRQDWCSFEYYGMPFMLHKVQNSSFQIGGNLSELILHSYEYINQQWYSNTHSLKVYKVIIVQNEQFYEVLYRIL